MSLTPRLLGAGTALLRVLPERVSIAVAAAAADACWVVLGRRRRIVAQNLDHLVPNASAAERGRLVRATFRNAARCYRDLLELPLLDADEIAGRVEWTGLEHLDAAVARGKGVLLLTGHLGNWDVGGIALAAGRAPFYAYSEDTGLDPATFRFYERLRTLTGITVIPISQGAFTGARALTSGASLIIVADRLLTGTGEVVRFGAGRRELPRGPAVLLRRSGATPLMFTVTLHPSRTPPYRGVMSPLDVPAGADDHAVAAVIARELSAAASRHPDQWFVFEPRWLPDDGEVRSPRPRS